MTYTTEWRAIDPKEYADGKPEWLDYFRMTYTTEWRAIDPKEYADGKPEWLDDDDLVTYRTADGLEMTYRAKDMRWLGTGVYFIRSDQPHLKADEPTENILNKTAKQVEDKTREELIEQVRRLQDMAASLTAANAKTQEALLTRCANYRKAKREANKRADLAEKALQAATSGFAEALAALREKGA